MPKEPIDLNEDVVRAALELLNEDGYINDENSNLGSTILEHYSDELEQALRAAGYDGPPLVSGGHFYQKRGAVYWLYNPGHLDGDEARALTDRWVQKQTDV